jgi:hypothetical protein
MIGDPDNQRPDKWSSTVFCNINEILKVIFAVKCKISPVHAVTSCGGVELYLHLVNITLRPLSPLKEPLYPQNGKFYGP